MCPFPFSVNWFVYNTNLISVFPPIIRLAQADNAGVHIAEGVWQFPSCPITLKVTSHFIVDPVPRHHADVGCG